MRIIAHRANLNGPDTKGENSLEAIDKCFDLGFEVELDIWLVEKKLILSHHFPQSDEAFACDDLLANPQVWWHAKNVEAFLHLQGQVNHLFWHQNDDFALTTSGYLWTYPGQKLTEKSIQVLPEVSLQKTPSFVFGVCTDYPRHFC